MKVQIIDTPIDCENIEHISTILRRYLHLEGLHPAEKTRTPEPKTILTSQQLFADTFGNREEVESQSAAVTSCC